MLPWRVGFTVICQLTGNFKQTFVSLHVQSVKNDTPAFISRWFTIQSQNSAINRDNETDYVVSTGLKCSNWDCSNKVENVAHLQRISTGLTSGKLPPLNEKENFALFMTGIL